MIHVDRELAERFRTLMVSTFHEDTLAHIRKFDLIRYMDSDLADYLEVMDECNAMAWEGVFPEQESDGTKERWSEEEDDDPAFVDDLTFWDDLSSEIDNLPFGDEIPYDIKGKRYLESDKKFLIEKSLLC